MKRRLDLQWPRHIAAADVRQIALRNDRMTDAGANGGHHTGKDICLSRDVRDNVGGGEGAIEHTARDVWLTWQDQRQLSKLTERHGGRFIPKGLAANKVEPLAEQRRSGKLGDEFVLVYKG